jgi:hypothetical protein
MLRLRLVDGETFGVRVTAPADAEQAKATATIDAESIAALAAGAIAAFVRMEVKPVSFVGRRG